MNPIIENRLQSIQSWLMALHQGGNIGEFPNEVKGAEREYFISEYLSKLLPTWYRFGSGAITDGEGNTSGQLDIVIEVPFSLSFPLIGYQQRLYLPNSVAVVIEVKSDLSSKWSEVLANANKLKDIKRSFKQGYAYTVEDCGNSELLPAINADIPVYVVAYKGPKNIDTLINNLDSSVNECGIAGVLIIESGFYVTKKFTAEGTSGLYAFVADLSVYLSSIVGIASSSLYNHADIKFR
ncbi:hypothetical protein PN450_15995 [Dolichospermum lemmermannii CS-548]|uniref:DUF6602 domain-containing protein n=1 Tax=Dolichospermum lemmermannii TaxID=54295 RepID=UPI00232F8C06|nr:DUF6602 domain-containing protein [Dolichospermum lemmermannii]MDB9438266.1 hypothetical protein [Dolichospermum lemmermannii CS-548]